MGKELTCMLNFVRNSVSILTIGVIGGVQDESGFFPFEPFLTVLYERLDLNEIKGVWLEVLEEESAFCLGKKEQLLEMISIVLLGWAKRKGYLVNVTQYTRGVFLMGPLLLGLYINQKFHSRC